MEPFFQHVNVVLHQTPRQYLSIARAICTGLVLFFVNAPWLPMQNMRLDGVSLVKMLGGWFTKGMPYSLAIAIMTAAIGIGFGLGLDSVPKLARHAIAERRLTKPLGYLLLGLVILLVFSLTNSFTLSLIVILTPALVVVYEGISIASLIPALKPGYRAQLGSLLLATLGMWVGLIWLAKGSGGVATSGWGYWACWLVVAAGFVIEAIDFWLEFSPLED